MIGDYTFSGRTGLTQIILPNSLTTIRTFAFFGCTGLTQITLPDGVTTIGGEAFSGCTGLTQITLPDSLTTIGGGAFSGCTGLTRITLPNSLTTIGDGAFSGCTGLTSIYFQGHAPVIGRWERDPDSSVWRPSWIWFEYQLFHNAGVTVYHLPGTLGWSDTFSGAPTALWLPAIGQPTPAGDPPDGRFAFPVEWAPSRQVTVEACPDLAHPDWQPVGTLTLDATGAAQFTDPDSASHPTRLYRLRTP